MRTPRVTTGPWGVGDTPRATRIDELLARRLHHRRVALAYGPPFGARDAFVRHFVLTGLRDGIPCIIVLTNTTATHAADRMSQADSAFPGHVSGGLVRFVDAYSRTIGEPERPASTIATDGLSNLAQLAAAIEDAQRTFVGNEHRLLFDSVSTLLALHPPRRAFRFFQTLVGRARQAGATTLLVLDRGMHAAHEVEAIKHLTDGVVEFHGGVRHDVLRLEGLRAGRDARVSLADEGSTALTDATLGKGAREPWGAHDAA